MPRQNSAQNSPWLKINLCLYTDQVRYTDFCWGKQSLPTHTHTHIHTHMHIQTHTHMHAHTHIYACTHTHTHIHTNMYTKTDQFSILNPFTAPACTISGLKDARTRLQFFYIPTYMLHNTSTFSVMRHDENLFTCQCKKEDKKAYCFKFRTFMCCFQMIPWQWWG